MPTLRFEKISTGEVVDIFCHIVKTSDHFGTFYTVENADTREQISDGCETIDEVRRNAIFSCPFNWDETDTIYHGWVY